MLGDSGTSFKTSPAIGKCLAEWVVHGKPAPWTSRPSAPPASPRASPWVDEDNYGRERLTVSR